MPSLTESQLLGLEESHVEADSRGRKLHVACREAFERLREDALEQGFELEIASAFRSFERQRLIWNAKADGERPLHDDRGRVLDASALDDDDLLHAILRYSAMPGASRHHWGTDLDIYDAAAVAADYRVQLTPQEVADDGPFGAMHRWLDARIESDSAQGFFRPYASDRGGVAPERWHISFAPLARECMQHLSAELLWSALEASDLRLLELIQDQQLALYQRYINNCDPS
jgi:LAS superfamily LD-carboxypeptidase LdcB